MRRSSGPHVLIHFDPGSFVHWDDFTGAIVVVEDVRFDGWLDYQFGAFAAHEAIE